MAGLSIDDMKYIENDLKNLIRLEPDPGVKEEKCIDRFKKLVELWKKSTSSPQTQQQTQPQTQTQQMDDTISITTTPTPSFPEEHTYNFPIIPLCKSMFTPILHSTIQHFTHSKNVELKFYTFKGYITNTIKGDFSHIFKRLSTSNTTISVSNHNYHNSYSITTHHPRQDEKGYNYIRPPPELRAKYIAEGYVGVDGDYIYIPHKEPVEYRLIDKIIINSFVLAKLKMMNVKPKVSHLINPELKTFKLDLEDTANEYLLRFNKPDSELTKKELADVQTYFDFMSELKRIKENNYQRFFEDYAVRKVVNV